MSNSTSDTTETSHSTNDDGEVCETPTNQEWVKCSKQLSDELELPSNCETNSETFLNVQVPSCQNFALGDTRRKGDQKMGFLPDREPFFSQCTETLKLDNPLPLPEDKTEPISLNEGKSPESAPIFSEFIEKLLFESTPLFDDDDDIFADTELADAAQSKRYSTTSIDISANISKTLKTLIENLEGLSKSLDETAKSSPILPNRLQLKVAASKRLPGRTNPLLPNMIHVDQNSAQQIWSSAIFPDFQNSKLECSDGMTCSIESSLKPIESSSILSTTIQYECNTSPHSAETTLIQPVAIGLKQSAENSLKQSEEDLAEPALHKELPLDSKKPVDAAPSIIYLKCSEPPSTQLTGSMPIHQSSSSLESQIRAAESSSVLQESSDRSKSSCLINFSASCDQTVQLTASQFGLKQSSENWDLLWVNQDPSFSKLSVAQSIEMYKNLKSYQRVNHFPGSWGLGLKDLLAKNLNYMYKYFPNEYNFFPKTWILPTQSLDLERYTSRHPESYFVIKPTDPSSAFNVKITKEIRKAWESNCESVCQVYLKPFLIDSYKFDFRVYVLVTSCDPLRIFVHSDGLARFATEKYEEPAQVNFKNLFMHLTNITVNVCNPKYIRDELHGSLRRLSAVFQWLRLNNFNVQKIQASMDDVIVKTIIANLATLRDYYQICFPRHSFSSACFQILGFDIMLDNQLKLYLLDVDCSPSFDCEGGDPFETELKTAILCDIFMILNLSESRRNQGSLDKENTRRRVTLLERLMKRKQEMDVAQRQIEWEDSHLGRFRKIYPPVACQTKYYRNLIDTALKNPLIV